MTTHASLPFTKFAGSPDGQANFMDIMRSLPMLNEGRTEGPYLCTQDSGNTLSLFIVEDMDASFEIDGRGRPVDSRVRGYMSVNLLSGSQMVHVERRPHISRYDEDCNLSDKAFPLWGAAVTVNRVPLYMDQTDEAAKSHEGFQNVWTFMKKFAPDHPYVAERLEEQGEEADMTIVQAVQAMPAARA